MIEKKGKKIVWTAEQDALIVRMRCEKASWVTIARFFGVQRDTVRWRGRAIGADDQARKTAPSATPMPEYVSRRGWEPLWAGHPVTWGAITRGTSLEGSEFESLRAGSAG